MTEIVELHVWPPVSLEAKQAPRRDLGGDWVTEGDHSFLRIWNGESGHVADVAETYLTSPAVDFIVDSHYPEEAVHG